MPLYRYKARNLEGEAQKGVVEAPNYEAASDELRERRLIVLAITEKSSSTWAKRWEDLFNRVSVRDITFFARQFSVLIGATIPIVRSLRILTRQTNNNYFKRVIADVAAEVDGGSKLSQAMTKYPKVFDGFFIHMIRAGETTGRLDQVFEYLANQKEKDYALISKVRGAMVYPAFIITVMIVVGILMAVYVVPPISNILTESGAAIPITTRILLGVSWFLQYYWWLAIIIIVAVGTAMGFYIQTESGHYLFDRLKIKMPGFGRIYQRIVLGRFAISLSNLLSSGVPLPTSLRIVGDIVNNAVYHDLIAHTVKDVESGNAVSSTFLRSDVVPPMVAQMINIGEETGKLDDILRKLGAFYAQEVDTSLTTLTSLIEPVIIILLGLGAFVMVSGILVPIYNATTSIA
jgi:type IV pilus assembly protein PilC